MPSKLGNVTTTHAGVRVPSVKVGSCRDSILEEMH